MGLTRERVSQIVNDLLLVSPSKKSSISKGKAWSKAEITAEKISNCEIGKFWKLSETQVKNIV